MKVNKRNSVVLKSFKLKYVSFQSYENFEVSLLKRVSKFNTSVAHEMINLQGIELNCEDNMFSCYAKTLGNTSYKYGAVGYRFESPNVFILVDYSHSKHIDIYFCRAKESHVQEMKERKANSYTRAELSKLIKTNQVFEKTDYKYTDDYAYDAQTNFGKCDEYSLLSDEYDLNELLKDVKDSHCRISQSDKKNKTFSISYGTWMRKSFKFA